MPKYVKLPDFWVAVLHPVLKNKPSKETGGRARYHYNADLDYGNWIKYDRVPCGRPAVHFDVLKGIYRFVVLENVTERIQLHGDEGQRRELTSLRFKERSEPRVSPGDEAFGANLVPTEANLYGKVMSYEPGYRQKPRLYYTSTSSSHMPVHNDDLASSSIGDQGTVPLNERPQLQTQVQPGSQLQTHAQPEAQPQAQVQSGPRVQRDPQIQTQVQPESQVRPQPLALRSPQQPDSIPSSNKHERDIDPEVRELPRPKIFREEPSMAVTASDEEYGPTTSSRTHMGVQDENAQEQRENLRLPAYDEMGQSVQAANERYTAQTPSDRDARSMFNPLRAQTYRQTQRYSESTPGFYHPSHTSSGTQHALQRQVPRLRSGFDQRIHPGSAVHPPCGLPNPHSISPANNYLAFTSTLLQSTGPNVTSLPPPGSCDRQQDEYSPPLTAEECLAHCKAYEVALEKAVHRLERVEGRKASELQDQLQETCSDLKKERKSLRRGFNVMP
ncbi:MAG: hypothetical protein Q9220_000117 [cf. Caloplaca sp. 1 TL-2023]